MCRFNYTFFNDSFSLCWQKTSVIYRLEDTSRWWIQTACARFRHADMKYTTLRIWAFGIPREELPSREQSTSSRVWGSHLSKTMSAAVERIPTGKPCLCALARVFPRSGFTWPFFSFWFFVTFAEAETSFLKPFFVIIWVILIRLLLVWAHSSLF